MLIVKHFTSLRVKSGGFFTVNKYLSCRLRSYHVFKVSATLKLEQKKSNSWLTFLTGEMKSG